MGLLTRHVRKATREYAARHELIVRTLERDFGDWLDPVPSAAGLHLCTRLIAPGDLAAVLSRAPGVAVDSLRTYYAGPAPEPGLAFGYGTVSREDISAGLRVLRTAFTAAG